MTRPRNGRYILQGTEPVPCDSLLEWGKWLESADLVVEETFVQNPVSNVVIRISTVFLGLDYRFSAEGEPLLFETMAFGEPEDIELFGIRKLIPKSLGYQRRYCTWGEAVEGHRRVQEDILLSIEVERARIAHTQR